MLEICIFKLWSYVVNTSAFLRHTVEQINRKTYIVFSMFVHIAALKFINVNPISSNGYISRRLTIYEKLVTHGELKYLYNPLTAYRARTSKLSCSRQPRSMNLLTSGILARHLCVPTQKPSFQLKRPSTGLWEFGSRVFGYSLGNRLPARSFKQRMEDAARIYLLGW